MLNTISLLKSLVNFDTESSKNNLPLIFFIERILKKANFRTAIQKTHTDSVKKANLIAVIGKGTNGLILSGHTDTVPVGSSWRTNPFQLTEKQGRLYGLGAVDMKGAIATIITSACQISKKVDRMKKSLSLVFTFDEESTFNGIKEILDVDLIAKTGLVIIGEPTKQCPVIAHKGVTDIKISIFGKEAHSSNPEQGINAIEIAGELIVKFRRLAAKIQEIKNPRFSPAYSTLNIGKIKGGTVMNKVPAFCVISLEYRSTSKKSDQEIFNNIKKIVRTLTKMNKGIKIEIEKKFVCSPFSSSIKKDTLSVIEVITNKKSSTASFATEAPFYEEYGLPTILLGPGSIKQAHKSNEFITKTDLQKAVKTYTQIIERFCF